MVNGAGQHALQRVGFGVVLLVALTTVGYAAVLAPSGTPTPRADTATTEEAAVATRSGRVVNGCAIQPGTRCPGWQLGGADLGGADLSGADLRSADLRSADLRGANLRGANLSGAHLLRAHLWFADLSGANLENTSLRVADLRGATLQGATLHHTLMPDGSRCSGTYQGPADCSWRP